MSNPTRLPLGQVARRALRETTRENIDPQPGPAVVQLQNDLAFSNLVWGQVCSDLEDELKAVKDQLALEMDSIIRLLMEEMIQTIERQLDQKRKKMDEVEEKQEKTCKFI